MPTEDTTPSTPAANGYENPWESAANDQLWEQAAAISNPMETSTTALLNGESNAPSSATTIGFKCFQACHVLDMIWGSTLALYAGLVLLKEDRIPSILLITLACLVIVRGVLAKITRCGVAISATISFGLTCLYLLLALLTYGVAVSGGQDCTFIPEWCQSLSLTKLALLFLLCGLFELARYLWIRQWMFEESTQVRDDLNASEVSYRQRQRQPWWWQSPSQQRGNIATEPLLNDGGRSPHWSSSDNNRGYHMDHGMGTPMSHSSVRNWWPFGRRQSTEENGRDDASVEYASLNEDWQSRSQEDPFWWTQEDGGGRNTQ